MFYARIAFRFPPGNIWELRVWLLLGGNFCPQTGLSSWRRELNCEYTMWNTRTNIDWVARPPIMNSLDMKAQNIKIFSSVNTAWEHPDSDFNLWEKIRASTFFFNWDIILPLSQVLHEDDETSLLIIAFMYLFLKSLNCFWRVRGGSSLHVSSQYKINKSYWLRDWLWDWLWDCWRGKIPSDDEFVTLLDC